MEQLLTSQVFTVCNALVRFRKRNTYGAPNTFEFQIDNDCITVEVYPKYCMAYTLDKY